MKKSISFFLIITLLIGLAACEDDPSSVGEGLLEGQDVTRVDSLVVQNPVFKDSYIDSINLGSAKRTLIGRTENLTSTGLLKFYFVIPDSIKTAMNDGTLQIESSKISLRPTYTFGEDGGIWDFETHEITTEWGSTEFNTDSLAVLGWEPQNLSSNILFADDTTITFDIDPEAVYRVMEFSIGDTTVNNYGFVLVPTASTNRVIGCPALTSVSDDALLPQLTVVVNNSGEYIDTLTATLINDAYAVEGEVPPQKENIQFIQGGLPVRTNLKFDISALPANAIIVDALMSVYTDTLSSDYGSKGTDTLVVSLLTDYQDNVVENDDNIYSLILTRNGNVFSGNIRRYIQRWIDGTANEGMQVKLSDEDRAVTKIALYDSDITKESLKPRIQIIYIDVK